MPSDFNTKIIWDNMIMKKILLITLAVALGISFLTCDAMAKEKGWHFVKEKKGAKLYTRPVKNSKYPEIRATTQCDASIEALLEVLLDSSSYTEWLPDCIEASTLELLNKDPLMGQFLLYFVIDSQWPVKNRDFVIKSNAYFDWDKGIAGVDLTSASTSEYNYPLRKGRYRVDVFKSSFKFERLTRNSTKITYTSYSEAAGKAPVAIVNSVSKGLTFKTVKTLAKFANDPIYQKRAMKDFF